MIKNITIGQYFPGNSPLHKCDPRTKFILTIAYTVLVYFASNIFSYILTALFLMSLIIISKIHISIILKNIKPLFFIIALTSALNIFYNTDGITLFNWRFINVTSGGLITAGFMVLRLIFIICGAPFLTYTTSPIVITDGLERLMSPLRIFKVPVHDIAMMTTIALRFIPILIDETDKIMSAQKSRGADFESGGIIKRAKALIPILVPLIISAFRRAEELATAMECRCYHGDKGRTRLRILKFGLVDLVALLVMIAFGISIFLLNNIDTFLSIN